MPTTDLFKGQYRECPTAALVFSTGLGRLVDHADLAELQRLLSQYCRGHVPCHGDFHPSNILDAVPRPVVLDWCDSFIGPAESDVATTIVRIRAAIADPTAESNELLRFRNNLEQLEASYLAAYDGCRKLDHAAVEAWTRLAAALAKVRQGGDIAVINELVAGRFSLPW